MHRLCGVLERSPASGPRQVLLPLRFRPLPRVIGRLRSARRDRIEDESEHPIGIRGRAHGALGAGVGVPEKERPIGSYVVQDRHEVVDEVLEGWEIGRRVAVRDPLPPAIDDDHPRERGQTTEEGGVWPALAHDFQAAERWDVHQVERSLSENTVPQRDVAVSRVPDVDRVLHAPTIHDRSRMRPLRRDTVARGEQGFSWPFVYGPSTTRLRGRHVSLGYFRLRPPAAPAEQRRTCPRGSWLRLPPRPPRTPPHPGRLSLLRWSCPAPGRGVRPRNRAPCPSEALPRRRRSVRRAPSHPARRATPP